MKIRRLEDADSIDLHEIYSFKSVTENTSQCPLLSCSEVTKLFSRPEQYTLVAEDAGKVVGHVSLLLTHKARDKHSAGLAIAVHPQSQGTGVGSALMHEILEQADNWLNLVRIELEVHADNGSAVALYKKLGFELEGTKRWSTFKNGRYIDMFLMSRIRPGFINFSE